MEKQNQATEKQQQTLERLEQKIEALNSETKKDNLNKEDRKLLEDIKSNQQVLFSQNKKWLDDANVKVKHQINIENNEYLSKQMSDKVVKEVAPEVADTFKRESATIKESTKKIEETFNKVNTDITRYKKIFVTGIVAFFVLACLILLVTAVTNGVFDFLGVSHLYEAISTKIKASHGFITVLWFITYFIPVAIWTGIVILLGYLTRRYML
ncbi:DUF334 domain-containing protein [Staphylococcus warneri]|uniref:DUF334 domain-containing protein n=1 Tax=Staphylococcus warneri TaxID=1292 RepID=UPI001D16256D|nr:DUF334 domain-containing protein [Staphylococcus warneri]